VTGVLLVEGASDKVAIETLARRRGRDLAVEDVEVVAIGGAQAVGRVLAGLEGRRVAGLCDVGEEAVFRRGLGPKQPVWRGRPVEDQLRRFLGSGARRKVRYAALLVDALELERMPAPLDGVLAAV
jgi:hypothetical protein